jgi:microcystin-dependent protein
MNVTKKIIGLLFICFFMSNASVNAQEGFIGEVKMFGGNFAPRSWALCQGQLLSISQNQALFSILGTTYGGDGRTTFGLPDLRGRVAMGGGTGAGLTPRRIGEKFGAENQYLTILNLPTHNHIATVAAMSIANILLSTDDAVRETPIAGDVPAVANFSTGANTTKVSSFGPATNTVNGQAIPTPTVTTGNTGSSQGFSIIQPTQVINYIICTQGVFPSRS